MRMYVPLLVHKLVKQNKGGVGSKNKEAQILCTEKSLWLCANGFFGCWITQKFKKNSQSNGQKPIDTEARTFSPRKI